MVPSPSPSISSSEEEGRRSTRSRPHDDHYRFDYEELAFATGNFSPSNLIGKGSHGSIYKAFLPHHPHLQSVAVKKSTSGRESHVGHANSLKLGNEIRTLSSFNRRQSPYIVQFLGAANLDRDSLLLSSANEKKKVVEQLLVMELLPNGSLDDMLRDGPTLSWAHRVEIIVQLAKAVEFLHPRVVHRDIKPSNIMFDSGRKLKLVDFGLAVSRVDGSLATDRQQPAGTIGYMDPHYATHGKLTTKVDVYSFGVVVLEIISGRKAIDVTRSPASVVEWAGPLMKKQRPMEICDPKVALVPEFLECTIRHLACVAARCVSPNPEDRPEMVEILSGLGRTGGCHVEDRVRLPSWMDDVVRSFKRMRMKRRLEKKDEVVKCATLKVDVRSDVSNGKLLLRELIADITLN